MLYTFDNGNVFAWEQGAELNSSLSAFTCTLCFVIGLAAIGIGKGILELLGGVVVIGLIVCVAWAFSWIIHAIPPSKGRQPPRTKDPPPEEEKKPTPRWLRILEDDGEDD